MTDAERMLWGRLRARQLGAKFRRQMWIAGFIADFAAPDAKLIVELDGGQHDRDGARDEHRSSVIGAEGYRVIRFWNNEVLENLEGVVGSIAQHLPSPSHPALQGGPLPLPKVGEGFEG
jgi:very-short-patch-repair endonuclease